MQYIAPTARPFSRCSLKRNARLTLTAILLLALFVPAATSALASGGQPLLDIPDRIPATVGESAVVTINLDGDGEDISGIIFSLDIDPTCLAFNTSDANGDGIPEAAQFVLPLQFSPSLSYQADDPDGKIDVVITDYSPPLASLPNGPLLALRFDVICEPDISDNSRISDITFSAYPPVSFGNPAGQSVAGVSSAGSVKIERTGGGTMTPTANRLDSHRYIYCNNHRHGDRHRHTHTNSHGDCHRDCHRDCHGNSYTYPNKHTNGYCHQHPNAAYCDHHANTVMGGRYRRRRHPRLHRGQRRP